MWSPNLVFLHWHQCYIFSLTAMRKLANLQKSVFPSALQLVILLSGASAVLYNLIYHLLCAQFYSECVFLFLSQQIAVRSCCLWWPTSLNSTWKSRKSRRLAASCSVTSWRCFTGKMWWEAQLPEIMYYFPLGYTELYQAYPATNPEKNTFWQLFVFNWKAIGRWATRHKWSVFYCNVNLPTWGVWAL